MDEDDTFDKLKRIPFEEMQGIVFRTLPASIVNYKTYGWTICDYRDEFNRRNIILKNMDGFTF